MVWCQTVSVFFRFYTIFGLCSIFRGDYFEYPYYGFVRKSLDTKLLGIEITREHIYFIVSLRKDKNRLALRCKNVSKAFIFFSVRIVEGT